MKNNGNGDFKAHWQHSASNRLRDKDIRNICEIPESGSMITGLQNSREMANQTLSALQNVGAKVGYHHHAG
jgi:hypothetical protein